MRNMSKSGWIFAGLLAGASGCSAENNVDTQNVKRNEVQAAKQQTVTPQEADEPVYQGRAVFAEAARPEFPKMFHGHWELERGPCATDPDAIENDAMIVRVDRNGYRMGDGAMSIKKIYLAPGDQKRLVIDAIYSGGGEEFEQTVIVQMSDDESEFRVWHKGEPETSATIFYRCSTLRP